MLSGGNFEIQDGGHLGAFQSWVPILVGYPTHMPSFIISSKSEIFCDYAA